MDDGGPRHHSLRDAAAERGPHARLPVMAQLAVEGKNETGRLSRHSRGRDTVGEAGAWRRSESHCGGVHAGRRHHPWPGQRQRRQTQHRSHVPRCTPAGRGRIQYAGRARSQHLPLHLRRQRQYRYRRYSQAAAASRGRHLVRWRHRARRGRSRRREISAARGQAAARTRGAVWSVRDEHARGNRAGARRLS